VRPLIHLFTVFSGPGKGKTDGSKKKKELTEGLRPAWRNTDVARPDSRPERDTARDRREGGRLRTWEANIKDVQASAVQRSRSKYRYRKRVRRIQIMRPNSLEKPRRGHYWKRKKCTILGQNRNGSFDGCLKKKSLSGRGNLLEEPKAHSSE